MLTDITRAFVRRLAFAVPTIVAAVVLVFVLIDLAPGDTSTVKGVFSSAQEREQFREENGLDDPLPQRLGRFLGDLVQGDLGESLVQGEPVADLLAERIPITLQLTAVALLFGLLSGLFLGTLAALYQDSLLDRSLRAIAAGGLAAPDFWIGLLAIQLFAIHWHVLPSGGLVPFSENPLEWLRSIVLPAAVLSFPLGGALALMLRAALIEEYGKDYVRTHTGSGLRPATILFRNVLPNALLAPMTVLGLRLGYLVTGAIVVESVFAIPGLGDLTIQAVFERDLTVLQGVTIFITVAFILINLLVDIVYLVLNPKLRTT